MKIGILGSGMVGQVLAKAFIKEGHQVTIGTSNPSKEAMLKFKEENPGVAVDSFASNSK